MTSSFPTLLAAAAALASGPLPLRPGTYAPVGTTCADATFADLIDYDGRGLGGAHAADCRSRIVSRHGSRVSVSNTCHAEGDGSTTAASRSRRELIPVDRTTFEEPGEGGAAPVRYRRCGPRRRDSAAPGRSGRLRAGRPPPLRARFIDPRPSDA